MKASHFSDTLGVPPLINAVGTFTSLGGSRMRDAAVRAATAASSDFVDMHRLLYAAGERVAELARCPPTHRAHICAGAAAGLTLSVAASVSAAGLAGAPGDFPVAPGVAEVLVDGSSDVRWLAAARVTGSAVRVVGGPGVPMDEAMLLAAIDTQRTADGDGWLADSGRRTPAGGWRIADGGWQKTADGGWRMAHGGRRTDPKFWLSPLQHSSSLL